MLSLFGRDDALAVIKGYGEAIHDGTTQDDLGAQAGDPGLDERLEALDPYGAPEFRSLDGVSIRQGPAAHEIRGAKLKQVPIGQDQKTVKPGVNESRDWLAEITDLKRYR
jgi:hypothetical protein